MAEEGVLMMAVEDLHAGFTGFCLASFPSVKVGSDACRVSLKKVFFHAQERGNLMWNYTWMFDGPSMKWYPFGSIPSCPYLKMHSTKCCQVDHISKKKKFTKSRVVDSKIDRVIGC